MLNLAMVNSYILYIEWFKEKFPEKRKPRQFDYRVAVIKQLLASTDIEQPHQHATVSHEHTRLHGRHFLHKMPTPEGKKKQLSRSCVVCVPAQHMRNEQIGATKIARKESIHECRQCTVTLCAEPCFELYHCHKDYITKYMELM